MNIHSLYKDSVFTLDTLTDFLFFLRDYTVGPTNNFCFFSSPEIHVNREFQFEVLNTILIHSLGYNGSDDISIASDQTVS